MTQQPYQYAIGDPLDVVDPTGECVFCVSTLTKVAVGVAIVGVAATGVGLVAEAGIGAAAAAEAVGATESVAGLAGTLSAAADAADTVSTVANIGSLAAGGTATGIVCSNEGFSNNCAAGIATTVVGAGLFGAGEYGLGAGYPFFGFGYAVVGAGYAQVGNVDYDEPCK